MKGSRRLQWSTYGCLQQSDDVKLVISSLIDGVLVSNHHFQAPQAGRTARHLRQAGTFAGGITSTHVLIGMIDPSGAAGGSSAAVQVSLPSKTVWQLLV
jgi:hypothetical protein